MSDSQNKCFCCKFNVSYHYLRPSGKNKEIWPFIAYDQPYGAHQASLSKTITPLKWNIIEYAKSRFSWASLVAQLVRIHLQCRRLGFDSWVWKIPWRRDRLPTPVFLGSNDKEYTCSVRDLGSIPELGRFPGRRHGNWLQYSCLENPQGQRAWWATVHGVAKSRTRVSD